MKTLANTKALPSNAKRFYSHGKLLLTSEYLVLDGAEAMAIPCRFGQDLCLEDHENNTIDWKAYTHEKTLWGDFSFPIAALNHSMNAQPKNEKDFLIKLLQIAKKLNPSFLKDSTGCSVSTHLEFPRDWGLGSSSTLIYNVAQWAAVDPFKLLALSMGGSGYDIACAAAKKPISYRRNTKIHSLQIQEINLEAVLLKEAVFIHLNQKQDSRAGINTYSKQKAANAFSIMEAIEQINILSRSLLNAKDVKTLMTCMEAHEAFIGNIIQTTPVKEYLFKDYPGAVKSLGAWGGDFIMAVSEQLNPIETKEYFFNKGYTTSFYYTEMVL